jgi:hypothetical protein
MSILRKAAIAACVAAGALTTGAFSAAAGPLPTNVAAVKTAASTDVVQALGSYGYGYGYPYDDGYGYGGYYPASYGYGGYYPGSYGYYGRPYYAGYSGGYGGYYGRYYGRRYWAGPYGGYRRW